MGLPHNAGMEAVEAALCQARARSQEASNNPFQLELAEAAAMDLVARCPENAA